MVDVVITLDKHEGYRAGELVNGCATITLQQPKKIRSIYLIVSGSCHVEWTERRPPPSSSRRRQRPALTYSGREQYLNSKIVLFGDPNGPQTTLSAGVHKYTITCRLPERLPSSLVHADGNIVYKATVVVDVPGAEETFERAFQVNTVLDLNRDTALMMAVQCEEVQSFCLCALPPSKAYVAVTVPQGGYIPHEKILVHCSVNNQSSAQFQYAVFALQQIITFRTTSPRVKVHKHKAKVVEHVKRFPRDTGHKLTELTGELAVPMCTPSCGYSAHISIDYQVKVLLQLAGYRGRRVVMRIPIKIGTVAIQNRTTSTVTVEVSPSEVPNPVSSSQKPSRSLGPPAAGTRDDPPSYADAMRVAVI